MSIDQKFLIRAQAEWNVGRRRKDDDGTAVGELAIFTELVDLIRKCIWEEVDSWKLFND